jgi:hypothetical protein
MQRCSPEQAHAAREKELARYRSKASREWHSARHPLNRYNNLVGFAEVYWDLGTRIDINYYFLGNRNTTPGKRLANGRKAAGDKYGLNPRCYYLYSDGVDAGYIPRRGSASEKRNGINQALDHVERTAEEIRCYVDLSHERKMVEYLDVDRFFSGGRLDDASSKRQKA